MPKVSIYIPDELLDQAKRLDDSDNTSRLVQRALEKLVDEHKRPPSYAQTPEESYERILEVRDRLLAEAKEDYEVGYATALDAASAMPLHVINDLANKNFDLEAWVKPYLGGYSSDLLATARPVETAESLEAVIKDVKAAAERRAKQLKENPRSAAWQKAMAKKNQPWWWLRRTADALGTMADPIGYDEFSFTPTLARQRGYIDALRELWSAIENPGHSWSDSLHELKQLSDDLDRTRSKGGEADHLDDENDDS
ncbi:MAG: hypothetical protein ACYDA3_01960 [Gaiellaceae bacterium]